MDERLRNFHYFLMSDHFISPSQISIVIQGPAVPQTFICIASIRKHLPQSEIVLSTWIGSDVEDLDYDVLVLSDDPGAVKCNESGDMENNVNRQLVSTRAGIEKASRKYILKIRTDFVLRSNAFLMYWDKFQARGDLKIFNHRVIVSSVFSRLFSDTTKQPMPFHPSDFYMFGLADDLRCYYNSIPLATKEEMGNWRFLYPDRKPYYTENHRYTPEQFFFFSYVKTKFPEIKFEDWTDFNDENIAFSNDLLFNNFIFLDYKQSGIYCEKFSKKLKNPDAICGLISFNRFQKEYKSRCDSGYVFKDKTAWINFRFRAIRRVKNFLRPFKLILKWILLPT